MVPIYDPERENPDSSRLCIDQFEFPNLACEYPVVHVKAREAALLCEALGKRLCDAHEWEGACAGALLPPETEYAWGKPRKTMTWLHNSERTRTWAYGADPSMQQCATASRKTPGCGSGYVRCGSNTYPTGAFPACVSRFGVYDQHGNVAEHMSLPLAPEELGSRGGHGFTEMKGSWFVFAAEPAHEDDCRWRAKDWHPSRVMDPKSHSNYHLGFRCCKDLVGRLDTP
jgi:formylglycine-generating enzyme required for sulfatase activity